MSATTPPEPAAASAPLSSANGSAAKAGTAKVMPRGSSTSLLFTIAVVLSSLVIAIPIAVSSITEGILDQVNPAGVKELDNGLAYLSEILGWSFGSLGVLLVVIIIVYALIYRRERTLDTLKLPLIIVALQIVLGVIALIFNAFAK